MLIKKHAGFKWACKQHGTYILFKPQEDTANVDVKIQLKQNFLIQLRWTK